MRITIRPATLADHEAVRQLHLTTHAEHATREEGYDAPSFEDAVLAPPEKGGDRGLLIAEVDGVFAGHLAYFSIRSRRARALVVSDISVRAAMQRRGVARALLTVVEELATSSNDRAIVAGIWRANTASQATFRALGYTIRRSGTDQRLVGAVKALGTTPRRRRWAMPLMALILLALGFTFAALGR